MAKRGEFFPWRIIFRYPNGINGTRVLGSVNDVLREGAVLLYRGADIDIAQVSTDTREATVLRSIRADEVDFDKDMGAEHYTHSDVLRAWMTAHPVTANKA